MYCSVNYETKSAFRTAVRTGQPITLYSPTLDVPAFNGHERVEGPWPTNIRPRPRVKSWRAEVVLKQGVIVEVR